MIRSIIVEDDKNYSDDLEQLVKEAGSDIKVLRTCDNVADAITAIETHKPDLVFLDVELGRETGFDLLKRIKVIDFSVIFTTGHINKHILEIRRCALTYLPKPIDLGELKEALKKFRDKANYKNEQEQVSTIKSNMLTERIEDKGIWVRDTEGSCYPVAVKKIIYCTSKDTYTTFVIKEDSKEKLEIMKAKGFNPDAKGIIKWMSSRGIGKWEDELEPYHFCRIHNSYLVNLMHVDRYTRGEGGAILMSNGDNLEVSRDGKARFLKQSGLK